MSISIGNINLTNISMGSAKVESIHLGNTLVFGDTPAVYTYDLKNVTLKYSSGSSVSPNGSNYAYLQGTYITYKNGRQEKSETVKLNITSISNDILVKDDSNNLVWNFTKYSVQQTGWTHVKVKGSYGTITSSEFNVSVDGNYNNVFDHSEIKEFTIDGNSSAFSFDAGTHSYDLAATTRRWYKWTSGVIDTYREIKVSGVNVNITSWVDAEQSQGGGAGDAILGFKNNGSVPVTIEATLEGRVDYWDPESQMPDYDTDYDSVVFTIQAGETYYTRNLRVDPYSPYTGSGSLSEYFKVDGASETYTVGTTVNKRVGVNKGNVTFSSPYSWVTINNDTMLATISSWSGSSSRTGSITGTDSLDATATKSLSFTQSAASYTFNWYGSSEQNLSAGMTSAFFTVTSYNSAGAVAISKSNVTVTNGATVNSVEAMTNNRYQISISFPANTSTTATKTWYITVRQPNSGKLLEGSVTQAKAASITYTLENYDSSLIKSVTWRSTTTTFKVYAKRNNTGVALGLSNVTVDPGVTISSINLDDSSTGLNSIVVTYPMNDTGFSKLMGVNVTLSDKSLQFTISQAGGLRPIDPEIPPVLN